MIKTLLLGVWVCIVMSGSMYGTLSWKKAQSDPASAVEKLKLETMKTRMISVPLLKDDDVQGYVICRFEITADAEKLKKAPIKPDGFVADEAFKIIYADVGKDYRLSRKQDLKTLTSDIAAGVNARLGSEIVRDVLIDSWTYVSKQDMVKINGRTEKH